MFQDFSSPSPAGKEQFQEVPFLDPSMADIVPLTADITYKADPEWIRYPEYRHEGRVYVDGRAWKILCGEDGYYLAIFEMDDPTGGLFGAFGMWTPHQTVLYDADKRPVSQHAEVINADHIRITQCGTPESLIRYLTVWGMADSPFADEIRRLNGELRTCYKNLIQTEQRIARIYHERECAGPDEKVNIYSVGDNTYEDFMKRNLDLM